MSRSPASSPLTRRFELASLRRDGTPVRFEATAQECTALAGDCGLPGIEAVAADLLVRSEGDGARVTGTVTARVHQVCVVSLEPFVTDLVEPVDVVFAPEAEVEALAATRAARPTGEDEAEDLPDPIVQGRIDLGALVAEMVALGLDPYPRKPGAAFAPPTAPDESASPFAVLRRSGQGD